MRVAIYARSAVRKDAAIEDQTGACRARALAEGWTVVQSYADSGASGMTMTRPGIEALLRDASARKFDAIVVTDLHRLSRNVADVIAIRSCLRTAGIDLVILDRIGIGSAA